jgi:addiction module HigA family antidote
MKGQHYSRINDQWRICFRWKTDGAHQVQNIDLPLRKTTMKTHSPIHPGEVLHDDFLLPLGLSEYRVAKDIGVPPRRINEVVKGKRAVKVDTALRLEKYFQWPARVWLNLQSHHDRQIAKEAMAKTLAGIKPCAAI